MADRANTPHQAACGSCSGQGVTYHGTGKYRTQYVKGKPIEVEIVVERTCSMCNGTGKR